MKCEEFWSILKSKDLTFFTGVPDSTFKDWMKFLADKAEIENDVNGGGLKNIIASNECEAIAITAGYHLATSKIGVVYMQNSGEGKTVNPITSLCDPEVYNIPVLLIIGWRGEPGTKDEPQHKKMGRITLSLLKTLEIPCTILPEDVSGVEQAVSDACLHIEKTNSPYALIVRKGLFEKYEAEIKNESDSNLTREDAIKLIIDSNQGDKVIISTTGKTSRELFEYRETLSQDHQSDFLTVGSMGCSSSIALGIAMQKPEKKVFVFDGDGAMIMQMGALATIGHYKPKNLYHFVFDNASYESTGGQPTTSSTINFENIATSCGYRKAITVRTEEELVGAIGHIKTNEGNIGEGPQMIIVKIKKGSRKDLGRPTTTPVENKEAFMRFLQK